MKYIIFLFSVTISTLLPQSRIQEIYDTNTGKDFLRHAQWSIHAQYTDTGEEIVAINSSWSLAPASGLKLLTSAAALEILGGDFKFVTQIYAEGNLSEEGILEGNIYFLGRGDPTLGSSLVKGSKDLNDLCSDIVEKLKSLKIKEIKGNIYADDFYFDKIPVPDNWYWIDLGNYYAAQASALTLNDNLYYLYLQPGNKAGDPTSYLRTEPRVPGLVFENHILTGEKGSGDNGYIYCAPDQYNAVLRGTIPAGVNEFSIKGSIPDPPLFAVRLLKDRLENADIRVRGNALKLTAPKDYENMKVVYRIESPPLSDIIYILNKRSNNLFTELLLKTIAKFKGGKGGTYEGIGILEEFLDSINVDRNSLQLYDGCGLSRSNMISAELISNLLTKMTGSKYFKDYYKSLAVAGNADDIGFFSSFGRGTKAENNARIKSGLIDRVRSHSGYINDSNGRMIAYSLIANNFKGSHRQIDRIHLEILIALAGINVEDKD